jgi:hypothetical protein
MKERQEESVNEAKKVRKKEENKESREARKEEEGKKESGCYPLKRALIIAHICIVIRT